MTHLNKVSPRLKILSKYSASILIDFLSSDLLRLIYSMYCFFIREAYFLVTLGSPISKPSLPLTSFGKYPL